MDIFFNDVIRLGRARRKSWPLDKFVYVVPAAEYPAQRGAAAAWFGEGAMIPYPEYIACSSGGEVRAWQAPHEDLLATDWNLL